MSGPRILSQAGTRRVIIKRERHGFAKIHEPKGWSQGRLVYYGLRTASLERSISMSWTYRTITGRAVTAITAAGTLAVVAATTAVAHPHVWVGTQSKAIFENGALTGLRYTWLFDEMYTASAIDGLDKNNDGKVEGPELDELTKINIEGLKEFEYFTTATMAGKPVTFGDAKDYAMEVLAVDIPPGPQLAASPPETEPTPAPAPRPGLWSRFSGWIGGLFGSKPTTQPNTTATAASAPVQSAGPTDKVHVLSLHMTLPLKAPIPAAELASETKGFQFALNDGQMYIWFEPTPKDGMGVAPGAPPDCRMLLVDQEMDEQQKKLQEAFGRVGGAAIAGPPKAIGVVCGKP